MVASNRVWSMLGVSVGLAVSGGGCGSNTESGGNESVCSNPPVAEKASFCASCQMSSEASPASCKTPRTVNACCAYVTPPPASAEVKRAVGLRNYAASEPTPDFSCLDNPPAQGQPQTVTVKGFVKLFSSGVDSEGVRVEFFKEGPNGALGERVGTAVQTTSSSAIQEPKPTWLQKCPPGGCLFRAYEYAGVPTETPLIVKTSDAAGGTAPKWSELYDYNVYFANGSVQNGVIDYDANAVASTDLGTMASAAGGFTINTTRGLLAGEVRDCGNVRITGATVDTDIAHEGALMYFTESEGDPLPDKSRAVTSSLGLFAALNMKTGVPVRVSALGRVSGKLTLLGTQTVQMFPNAVTAFAFRGRRPWQK